MDTSAPEPTTPIEAVVAPRKTVYKFPFGVPHKLDKSGVIDGQDIKKLIAEATVQEISILLRESPSEGLSENRGGYIFNVRIKENGSVEGFTFRKALVYDFPDLDSFTEFVNHVAGRKFSATMQQKSEAIRLSVIETEPQSDEAE